MVIIKGVHCTLSTHLSSLISCKSTNIKLKISKIIDINTRKKFAFTIPCIKKWLKSSRFGFPQNFSLASLLEVSNSFFKPEMENIVLQRCRDYNNLSLLKTLSFLIENS